MVAHTDLIATGIHVLCSCLVAFFILGIGLSAGVVRGSKLDISFRKVRSDAEHSKFPYITSIFVSSRVNHFSKSLTASSIVKKDLILLQCGEVLARFVDVERHSEGLLVIRISIRPRISSKTICVARRAYTSTSIVGRLAARHPHAMRGLA